MPLKKYPPDNPVVQTTGAEPQIMTLAQPEDMDRFLSVFSYDKLVIKIDLKTGNVEVAEGFTPTETARLFWMAMHQFLQQMGGGKMPSAFPLHPHTEPVAKLTVTLPKNERVETGPTQFNEDWPGIFIRGDESMWYGFNLNRYLDNPAEFDKDVIGKALLRGLSELLSSCDERRLRQS